MIKSISWCMDHNRIDSEYLSERAKLGWMRRDRRKMTSHPVMSKVTIHRRKSWYQQKKRELYSYLLAYKRIPVDTALNFHFVISPEKLLVFGCKWKRKILYWIIYYTKSFFMYNLTWTCMTYNIGLCRRFCPMQWESNPWCTSWAILNIIKMWSH